MKPATPLRFSSMLAATVLLTACGRSDLLPTHGKSGPDQSKSGPDASLPSGSDLQGHPWPVFGRDPQGTRRSPVDTSGNTGKLKWRLTLGKPQPPKTIPQLSSPVISKDGTVYVSSVDRTLYAVAPPTTETRATLKWSYTAPAPETPPGWKGEIPPSWEYGYAARSPALGPDGTVYVSTLDSVCALDTEGLLKWSYRDPDSFYGPLFVGNLGSPTVGADGTVYIAGSKLFALDPQGDGTNGVLKWSAAPGGGSGYPPFVAHDGTIILNSFRAIQPPVRGTEGTLAWSFQEQHGGSSPAIAADGTVYVGGYDKYVRAFSPPPAGTNGVLKWSYLTNSLYHTSPAIGADGSVYVAANVYGVFALRPTDGELLWRWYHGDNQWSSEWPAVGADGTIYLAGHSAAIDATSPGNVHAISPPTAGSPAILKWVFQTDDTRVSAPAIGADGTVYVTSGDTLYAIR